MSGQVDSGQLRAMIRELIRESLPLLGAQKTVTRGTHEIRPVQLTSDTELNSFVRSIIGILDDPREAPRLRTGAITFRLAAREHTVEPTAPERGTPNDKLVRLDRGAVTEKVVNTAAAQGDRIVITGRAVLTPLARDAARRLGVDITKEV